VSRDCKRIEGDKGKSEAARNETLGPMGSVVEEIRRSGGKVEGHERKVWG